MKFIQRITSRISLTGEKIDKPAEMKRWFGITVRIHEGENALNKVYDSPACQLESFRLDGSKEYRLTIFAKHVKGKENRTDLQVGEACKKISVSLTLNELTGLIIKDPTRRIPVKDRDSFEIEFDMETEANLFGQKPELNLKLSADGHHHEIKIPVMIDDCEFEKKECEKYNQLRLCLTSLPPEILGQIAIMHVEPKSETNEIRLLFFNPGHEHDDSDFFVPPMLDPLEFVDKEEGEYTMPPEMIKNKVWNTSESYERINLKHWINKKRRQAGDDLTLVIVDHSGLNIWWEMWHFGDGEYLGTCATIIRWLPVPVYAGSIYSLAFENKKSVGKVFLHVDEDRDAVGEEIAIFSRFANATRVCDYKTIRNVLKDNSRELGLVYVGGEGYYERKKEDRTYHSIAIGKKNSPEDCLYAINLESLNSCDGNHPFFFLNSCASACLAREQDQFFGFPFLLRYFKNGFIGTIGRVENRHAIEVAKKFFDFHDDDNGMLPARALRDLRSRVAEKLKSNKDDELTQYEFIYTFMYVYYGNPMAELRLIPNEKMKNGHGTR